MTPQWLLGPPIDSLRNLPVTRSHSCHDEPLDPAETYRGQYYRAHRDEEISAALRRYRAKKAVSA